MSRPAANALDDRKSDAGRPSPDLSKRLPDSASLFETAKTFQVQRRGAENNPTPRRSPIPFRRTPERAETMKFVQPFEREADRDLILLNVRLTATFQPRRLIVAPAADGCKRWFGGSLPHFSVRRHCARRARTASTTFRPEGRTPRAAKTPPSITVSPSTRTLNSPIPPRTISTSVSSSRRRRAATRTAYGPEIQVGQ